MPSHAAIRIQVPSSTPAERAPYRLRALARRTWPPWPRLTRPPGDPGTAPQALTDAARDPLAREAAIGELVSTSLVTRLDNNTIQVHRLGQEITRSRLDKRDTAIWTQHAVQLIRAAIPHQPNLREHWDRMSSLAPHAHSQRSARSTPAPPARSGLPRRRQTPTRARARPLSLLRRDLRPSPGTGRRQPVRPAGSPSASYPIPYCGTT